MRRGRRLTGTQHVDAVTEFDALVGDLHIASVTDELIVSAAEPADLDYLRGYDAVAAALTVEATVFSSADTDLSAAAARRGLHVANPLIT